MLEQTPREVSLMMTADQRQVLHAYVHSGPELEVVAMGGTRYGGKTFTGAHCIGYRRLMYPNTRALALRTIQRASDLNMGEELRTAFFEPNGFPVGLRRKGQIQFLVNEKRIVFPNGSMIQLGYCKSPEDALQHLGLQWEDIWIEQAEQFTEKIYDLLRGSNRPNNTNCDARTLLTFNPGGIGTPWLNRRIVNDRTRDRRVLFVRSDVRDCIATLVRDPSYIQRTLLSIADPVLREQWLGGNFDIFSNEYFHLVPETEQWPGTVQEIEPPRWAQWYCGVDWGHGSPFACLWSAHWKDRDGRNHLHICGEVYQSGLDQDQQAYKALEYERTLQIKFPSMHAPRVRLACWSTANRNATVSTNQSWSTLLAWNEYGFYCQAAPKLERVPGWQVLRRLMRNKVLTIDPACMALISEIKGAQREELGEDIDDKKCPDHALDALRNKICYLFGLNYRAEPEEDKRWDKSFRAPGVTQ
jgi:hypothetical protein